MTTYADFLAAKAKRVPEVGRQVDLEDIHPMLHPWQARIVQWAVRKGRAALFEDTGLGKTIQQVQWASLSGDRALILAPLSVARQTVREAAKVDTEVRYVRHQDQVSGPGIYITNYEMADRFNASSFDAVVLDESSCIKAHDRQTRQRLTAQWRDVPARLVATATPAPNDHEELCNQAEFLGVMPRAEMLGAYFVHDDDGWRLKGHAHRPMYQWMASWAIAMRRPSDLGYPDEGYKLPPLRILEEVVDAELEQVGQLFATDLGGVGGRHRIRRQTLDDRVERAVELAGMDREQWIIWCGLNAEAEAMTEAIDGSVNVEGSMSPEAKAEALEAFQDGEFRVLVSKPSVCGWGMNFQNCHKMAFLGLSDSFESYYQAIRRCWRYGQAKVVEAHIVVSDLELQIVDNVRRKEEEAARMIDELVRYMAPELGVCA